MSSLPIQSIKQAFLNILESSSVIVEAETGSGKSTCLPLWAADKGRVLVVEPRRIACTSLAEYLAQQRGESVGEYVGYSIKLENCFNEQSQVVFVTPGVALRWYAEDKLAGFDIVMVDEFHERRWDTDLLVAVLKQQHRIRMIVTSATIEGERLSYYLTAPRLKAQGRVFDVNIEHRALDSRYLPDSRNLAERVKKEVVYGLTMTCSDMLVFLPGRKEIQQCQQVLAGLDDVIVVPLHASVSDADRALALNPQTQQKVVLATNVAETSLTIPNISIVIDSGLERRNEQRNGRTTLTLKHISKASMTQRSGRAGRVMDGIAIRLYGEHAPMELVTPPALQREELVEPLLAAASCGYRLSQLEFLEPLPERTLDQANSILKNMKAIDEHGAITSHGTQIAPLPVDALYADLVARIENRALKEAMIDLTAALAVPASLYKLSSSEEVLETLNQEEPLHCDGQLLIQLVRGNRFSGVNVDIEALKEAQGLSEQMREIYQLPQLEVASRYQQQQLTREIAKLHPELVFVRREKRKEALGNGLMEVLVGRNSRLQSKDEASIVLDQHSLPGRGVKQTLTLAVVMMPISFQLIEELGLGEWQQIETSVENGSLMSQQKLVYAGRVIKTQQVEASGDFIVQSIIEAVKAEQCLPGFAKQRRQDIELWKIYVELGHDASTQTHHDLTFEDWFAKQLVELEIGSLEELQLFEADDFPFDGVPYWEKTEFAELYPFEVVLSDLQLRVEYWVKRKLVVVIHQGGMRKGDPKRWELPRWAGYKVQYRKASRVIDIK